ncbi:hypothetical protein STW0522RAO56_42110 [Raoultella planticola]|nr:hypothetical protein STW0522RAO56_42110 [Raoultella planticola]
MNNSIKMPVVHLSLPVPENFTGKVLVNVEKGVAINGFPLRPDEFVGSVDSFIECCRLTGFKIVEVHHE